MDLDVGIHHSMRILLQEGLTILVWEPETAMEEFTKWKKGDFDRTLMLSGIVASGIRESDFLGYLVNWISANYVSLRHGNGTSVLDATGPKACAEAYRYFAVIMHEMRHVCVCRMCYVRFSVFLCIQILYRSLSQA